MNSAEFLASDPRYQAARATGRAGAVSTEQARFDRKHRGLKRWIGAMVPSLIAWGLFLLAVVLWAGILL